MGQADPEVLDVGDNRLIPIMQHLTEGRYLEHLSEAADLAEVESLESDFTEVESRHPYGLPGYQAHVDEQLIRDRSFGESYINAAHKAIENFREIATIQQFRNDDRIRILQKVLTKSRSTSVKLQAENKKLKSQIRADESRKMVKPEVAQHETTEVVGCLDNFAKALSANTIFHPIPTGIGAIWRKDSYRLAAHKNGV
jgi:ribosomal protein L31E